MEVPKSATIKNLNHAGNLFVFLKYKGAKELPLANIRISAAACTINPLVTYGFFHPYHLDESTFILRDVRSNFSFLFHFSMKFMSAKRIAPDGTLRLWRHIWAYSVCLCPIKGRRAYMG